MSVPSFIIPPSDPTGADPNFALKQALAKRALERSGDYSPIQSPWQGLARMGDALVGALAMRSAAEDTTNANKSLMEAFGMSQAGQNAQPSSQTGGALGQFLTGQQAAPAASPAPMQNGGNPAPVKPLAYNNDGTELGSYLSDDARRATLPAGMRNNNPGNIKYVGQKIPGIVGPSQNTDQGDPQAVFDSPESGMRAMYSLLGKKYAGGKVTPNEMIAGNMGWTPGNYQAAANVARTMGIGPNDDIGFSDPARASQFMHALILQEHGQKGNLYPLSMINAAIGGNAGQASPATAFAPQSQPNAAAAAIEAIAPQSHDSVVSAPNYNPSAPNPLSYTGSNAAAAPAADAISSQAPQQPVQVAQNGQMDANYFPPAPAAPPQSPTLGGQLAAYGGGGMQNGMNPKLLAALLNPALPDSARQLGMGMLQMQMQPKNDFLTRPDGSVVMVNKFTGQAQVVQPPQRNPVFQQVDDPVTGLKRTIAVDPISGRPLGELTPNGMVQPGQQQAQAAPGSNGIDIFTGKPNAPAGQVPLAGAPLTNDVKDYRAYAMDQQSRGEPVKSFNDWSMDQKKAGAQSVTIAGETEESKALGAARAKNIVDYMEAGKSARDKLQALQIMEGALAAPGGTDFTTGPGAEMALKAKQALSSLTGQPLDGVTNAELFKKMGAYLASAAAKDLANRPTQFDFKTFLENNPGLDISEQGNRVLINLMKQQAQHQMDLSRLAQSYKGNTADWNDVVAEYDKSHPIMNPMTGKALAPSDTLGFPDGAKSNSAADLPSIGARPRAVNPQTKEVLEFDGQKWVPVQ